MWLFCSCQGTILLQNIAATQLKVAQVSYNWGEPMTNHCNWKRRSFSCIINVTITLGYTGLSRWKILIKHWHRAIYFFTKNILEIYWILKKSSPLYSLTNLCFLKFYIIASAFFSKNLLRLYFIERDNNTFKISLINYLIC